MCNSCLILIWAAKLLVLLDLCERDRVNLGNMAIRVADHDYASTDPNRGHFWRLWEAGQVDPLVSRGDVDVCLLDGPADGRGWARGRLIRDFGDRITDVDWSHVDLRGDSSVWGSRIRIDLPGPGRPSRDVFRRMLDEASDVRDLRRLLWHEQQALTGDTDGQNEDDSDDEEDEGEEKDLQDEIIAPKGGSLRLT